MRKFVYYNNSQSSSVGDPDGGSPTQFYNYMKGLWKDGTSLFVGGTGFAGNAGAGIYSQAATNNITHSTITNNTTTGGGETKMPQKQLQLMLSLVHS